jgi:hypothetical protein
MAFEMAGSTGLEPAASGVTGRRYNHLNYDPRYNYVIVVGEEGIEPPTSSL